MDSLNKGHIPGEFVNIRYMKSFCSGIVSTFRLSFGICFIRILPKQLKFEVDEKHGIGSIRKHQLMVSAIFGGSTSLSFLQHQFGGDPPMTNRLFIAKSTCNGANSQSRIQTTGS